MDGQLITAALTGPLLLLGVYELAGVKRLFSWTSLKIFFWGLVYAALSYPALAFFNVVSVVRGRETLFLMSGQSVRIWLFLFGLAVVGRWGLAVAHWLWGRRPRPTRYDPEAETDTKA
jgi:hypothetical protein